MYKNNLFTMLQNIKICRIFFNRILFKVYSKNVKYTLNKFVYIKISKHHEFGTYFINIII